MIENCLLYFPGTVKNDKMHLYIFFEKLDAVNRSPDLTHFYPHILSSLYVSTFFLHVSIFLLYCLTCSIQLTNLLSSIKSLILIFLCFFHLPLLCALKISSPVPPRFFSSFLEARFPFCSFVGYVIPRFKSRRLECRESRLAKRNIHGKPSYNNN